MSPTTNWQRAYTVRTTLEQAIKHLCHALATKDTDEVLSSFKRLEETTKQLKQMYVLESKKEITQTYLDSCC